MNLKRFNTEEDIDIVLAVKKDFDRSILSLRQAAEFVSAKTGKPISHEGLRKIFSKVNLENERRRQEVTVGVVPGEVPA